ncbi:hypothetical protein NERG_02256 [Nematocida ausubeli]|uniref:Uncharacterized protein n=1 Tax=Nematocida ausubeli (strain ATCC PRA-371 / ERTm2) TaxID=1913371 RepID=H8ZF85_NEMA1|nr:hypothetical protein NERG_02256 [Nematocida ausubeli]
MSSSINEFEKTVIQKTNYNMIVELCRLLKSHGANRAEDILCLIRIAMYNFLFAGILLFSYEYMLKTTFKASKNSDSLYNSACRFIISIVTSFFGIGMFLFSSMYAYMEFKECAKNWPKNKETLIATGLAVLLPLFALLLKTILISCVPSKKRRVARHILYFFSLLMAMYTIITESSSIYTKCLSSLALKTGKDAIYYIMFALHYAYMLSIFIGTINTLISIPIIIPPILKKVTDSRKTNRSRNRA